MTEAGQARPRVLSAAGERMVVGPEPWLMGIVNASPDSFSDSGLYIDLEAQLSLAAQLVADGARIIDVGGETASPARPQLQPADEISRVVPLIEAIRAELQVLISIDTYKPAVAAAAIAAGASIVNGISGLADAELARICAESGAALVVMHNRGQVKRRLLDSDLYDDVVADVTGFFADRLALADRYGVTREQVILDPGPDFSKTPAQTVEVLRALEQLHAYERPILLSISHKDVIGALTHRTPRDRLAGTLAALDDGLRRGAHIFRVHDVASAADYTAVRAVLKGGVTQQTPRLPGDR